jgi:hypothetical protein
MPPARRQASLPNSAFNTTTALCGTHYSNTAPLTDLITEGTMVSHAHVTAKNVWMRNVLLISIVTAVGGFLFGFDNGSISGSVGFCKTDSHWMPMVLVGSPHPSLLDVLWALRWRDHFPTP